MYVHKHTITVHERSHKGKWGEMSYNINNCLRLILKKLKKNLSLKWNYLWPSYNKKV